MPRPRLLRSPLDQGMTRGVPSPPASSGLCVGDLVLSSGGPCWRWHKSKAGRCARPLRGSMGPSRAGRRALKHTLPLGTSRECDGTGASRAAALRLRSWWASLKTRACGFCEDAGFSQVRLKRRRSNSKARFRVLDARQLFLCSGSASPRRARRLAAPFSGCNLNPRPTADPNPMPSSHRSSATNRVPCTTRPPRPDGLLAHAFYTNRPAWQYGACPELATATRPKLLPLVNIPGDGLASPLRIVSWPIRRPAGRRALWLRSVPGSLAWSLDVRAIGGPSHGALAPLLEDRLSADLVARRVRGHTS